MLLFLLFSNANFAQNKNLDYYLNVGLVNSPLIKDFQNQLKSNGIDSQRLKATFSPQISGVNNSYYSPIINGWGYDEALSNIGTFNDWVNVNKTFIGKKSLNTQYRSIGLSTDSLRIAQKISEQDLKRNITAQYITAYGDLQQLLFYTEVNDMLKNQESILKKLTQNNIYRQTDYLSFLVTFKQQQLQLKQLQIKYRNDFSMLNYLCGIFDTSSESLEDPSLRLQQIPDVNKSAFFLRYKITDLKLANQIKVLDNSYRPKLGAFANAGYSSTLLITPYKNFGMWAGVNLTVPIYDGHKRSLQKQQIRISANTNDNYKDFFSKQYGQQIALLKQQLKSTESLISDIEDQIKYAEELIKVNGKLLETGDTKIADFLIAINNYLNAKNLLTKNSINQMQIINQINYWNR